MNYAVYATRLDDENRRDASRIKLDASGEVINPLNPWGHPWAPSAILDAQEGRAWLVYSDAMNFLDSVIGDHRDVSTRNAFSQATGKIKNAAHAESLLLKLQVAALNGCEAALIGYAAASIYINRLAFVDFGWFVCQAEIIDCEGFAVTIPVPQDATPSIEKAAESIEAVDRDLCDYESSLEEMKRQMDRMACELAESIETIDRVLRDYELSLVATNPAAIVISDATAPQIDVASSTPVATSSADDAFEDLDHDLDFSIFGMEADDEASIVLAQPAPLAPVAPAPTPRVLVTPVTITDVEGRVLTATATGWQAESESKPGTFHHTAKDGSSCSCWGSRRWGKCWHRTAVYAHNKRKRDTARPVSKSRPRKPRKQGTIRPRKRDTARHTYHPPRPRERSRMWK